MAGFYVCLAVSLVGAVAAALAYRAKPSRPRLWGLIGFAVVAVAKLAAEFGYDFMPQLVALIGSGRVLAYYHALTCVGAVGLAFIVYGYWRLAPR